MLHLVLFLSLLTEPPLDQLHPILLWVPQRGEFIVSHGSKDLLLVKLLLPSPLMVVVTHVSRLVDALLLTHSSVYQLFYSLCVLLPLSLEETLSGHPGLFSGRVFGRWFEWAEMLRIVIYHERTQFTFMSQRHYAFLLGLQLVLQLPGDLLEMAALPDRRFANYSFHSRITAFASFNCPSYFFLFLSRTVSQRASPPPPSYSSSKEWLLMALALFCLKSR